MDVPSSAYVAMGAIAAAIITAGISFLISVLAKDQKTSEFRQAWIDGLRDDIAEFISLFYFITDVARELSRARKGGEEVSAFLYEKDEQFCKLEMTFARIKLRINPNENMKLLSALSALKGNFNSGQIIDQQVAETLVDVLIKESQLTLKNEWKRVKHGELVFVITKWVYLLILIAALSIGIVFASVHLHMELLP